MHLHKVSPHVKVSATHKYMSKVISPVKVEDRKKLDLKSGDTIRVHQKIKDGDKYRVQVFEGLVLARKHGSEAGATFTVRKVVDGTGVERIFPLYSPIIEKIEVIKRSKTRRAKLYFVRRKAVKEMKKRMKMEFVEQPTIVAQAEEKAVAA
jgi:large subunit ribosomal protein L19